MAATLANLVRVQTTTTGTGTVTLGSAVTGYLTFALGGISDGDVVTYVIESADAREVGRGTYTASGTTLSRDTVLSSTNGGNKISLSGTSDVRITAATEDFAELVYEQFGTIAPHKEIVVLRNATNPAYQIDYSATKLVAFDSNGYKKVLSSDSATVDLTVSGAGGLDTGSEANSTWYHIFRIVKEDDTASIIFSTSATAPTMPSGYTYKAYVGAVYNDSSGDIVDLEQIDRMVHMTGTPLVVSAGTATSLTSVDISARVPTTAAICYGYALLTNTSGAARSIQVAPSSTAASIICCGSTANTVYGSWRAPMTTSQTIYYRINSATSANANIYVLGWEF